MKRWFTPLLIAALVTVMLLSSCIRLPFGIKPGSGGAQSASILPETPAAPPAATDWNSGVKTDYTYLTPYEPPTEQYTRLQDGALPDLMPSGRYGTLLPYVGETMYSNDGYSTIQKYGLVTDSGMIVTDPVYTWISQGNYYNYSTYAGEDMPVYDLVRLSEPVDRERPWESERHAACALDGSWVTPFDYTGVFCTDRMLMLVRDYEKNDIDIMDFSGKLLYNTKALDFHGDIPEASAYAFSSGYGEGLIALPLRGDKAVVIDALTGTTEAYLDYDQCNAFSEGYAAVRKDDLYGFIDRRFNLVISPQFALTDTFYNGKCVVEYPGHGYAVIDAGGNVLLENENYIARWDSSFYGVYDSSGNVAYYDSRLNKLAEGSSSVSPISGGWLMFPESDGVTIIKGDEKLMFRDISGISSISGRLVAFYESSASSWQEGLMTLDGGVIIPPTENLGIAVVGSKETGRVYAIANSYEAGDSHTVYDSDGKVLFSGSGYVVYMPQFDLFRVADDFSFAYKSPDGGDIFRLSLLQYLPD